MSSTTNEVPNAVEQLGMSEARTSHAQAAKGLQPLENGKSCLPSSVGVQSVIKSTLVDETTTTTGPKQATGGKTQAKPAGNVLRGGPAKGKTHGASSRPAGKAGGQHRKNVGGRGANDGGPSDAQSVGASSRGSGKSKPSGHGIGSPKDGQARHVIRELNVYQHSKLYHDAIDKGFKNQAALDAFNGWVGQHIDDIDPREQIACSYCGRVDLILCTCFIKEDVGAIAVVDDALVIPAGRKMINIHYSWFGKLWRRVIRGYDESKFNFDVVNNHHINEVSDLVSEPEVQLQVDENILENLYNFIRAHQHTSYDLSGVDNRQARLAHSHKLALRWVTQNKLDSRLMDTRFVNQLMITVQRATDQVENNTLYSAVDPNIKKPGLFKTIKNRLLHGKTLTH